MADGEDRGVIETVDKGHTARYLLKVQRSYGFENSGGGSSYCGWWDYWTERELSQAGTEGV